MKLETMTEKDVELRVRLETDPQLMAELGGPRPREAIERAHAKSLALAAEGRCWPLKIIPDGGSSPAGGVDVFESSHEDEAIYEIGWMILPEFQNRGIASQAVREVLERARGVRKFGQIHAFPAVTNGPSNKICEKNGFTNLGECDVEFAGRGLRCNHWRIDLFWIGWRWRRARALRGFGELFRRGPFNARTGWSGTPACCCCLTRVPLVASQVEPALDHGLASP
jgi:RimJ/RimL family protein N-acetyltransferase